MDSGQSNKNTSAEFLPEFLAETEEHLEQIEMNLLDLETDLKNIDIVNSLFRSFHTIKGLAGFVEQDVIQEIAHITENLLDDCKRGTIEIVPSMIDLLLTSSDLIRQVCEEQSLQYDKAFLERVNMHLEMLDHPQDIGDKPNVIPEDMSAKKLGEILIEQGSLTKEELGSVLQKQATMYNGLRLGQVVVKEKVSSSRDVIEAVRKQSVSKERSVSSSNEHTNTTRVSAERIDTLVDLVGELVISESLIEQQMSDRLASNDPLVTSIQRLSKNIKSVQDTAMSLRMVSLRSTFQRVNRIARDAIRLTQKNIQLQLVGEDTEIDRNVAEKLIDPLVHLVRNAVDHGIEYPAERRNCNKNETGVVSVVARNKRNNVYIEVTDDGKGIDPDNVYLKAVEKNLINKGSYTEKEKLNLIFMSGFSTKEDVDKLSGRGVGMDVVMTEVSDIGGSVRISSSIGKGTTFTLKIPINMALMNGTIISLRGQKYILPTQNVKQIIRSVDVKWVSSRGQEQMMVYREGVIPVVWLEDILALSSSQKSKLGVTIVIEYESELVGISVDNVLDRREVVVKPLRATEFRNIKYFAGASILSDGAVSLILDIGSLFNRGGRD